MTKYRHRPPLLAQAFRIPDSPSPSDKPRSTMTRSYCTAAHAAEEVGHRACHVYTITSAFERSGQELLQALVILHNQQAHTHPTLKLIDDAPKPREQRVSSAVLPKALSFEFFCQGIVRLRDQRSNHD